MRSVAVVPLLAALLCPAAAEAAEPPDDRPFGKGTILPSFSLGFSWSRDLTTIGFGGGARYFVVNGLAFGLVVDDEIFIYSSGLKADFPGVSDQLPTNIFRVTPVAQYVFYRSRWFSPYIYGGVGPGFFNHGGGTLGQWRARPGAYIGVGGPVFLDVGVNFTGMFPVSKCDDAFVYDNAVQFDIGLCSFNWGPHIGIGISFGGGRKRRRDRRDRDREPPPPNPMPAAVQPEPEPEPPRAEPPPEPESVESPEPEPELPIEDPAADAPPPVEGPPDAEPIAAPDDPVSPETEAASEPPPD